MLSCFFGFGVGHVLVDLVLVPENVVVNIELFGRLRREHKRLHEPPHGLAIVGQFAGHLDHHAAAYGQLTVHLSDLGVAVFEVELADFLVDFQLTDDRLLALAQAVHSAVHEHAAR
ncbi:hypothetical protein BpHYR1_044413 [Brachionus plicatilis]|uniref:Uncharacterized protein n=1 Tax=Brachionus plicatilis TaxID=10195 RepID=A0A3M7RGN6_BRAPC|nr:hypothetical protein BpHYR1_044413 [Brachionus plicatilis]